MQRQCEGTNVSILLRVVAGLLVGWALLLWPLRWCVLPASELTPLVAALANGWAAANLVCALVFWRAASAPSQNLTSVYAALLLTGLKTAGDLHGLLFLEPPQALASLADLVLSVALFVGILRELPRTLEAATAD
jgi:hypothetical protein